MRYKTAIIILAAGDSSRMGTPKQLIVHNNNTLLQNTINAALGAKVGDVYLVLGANAQVITDRHMLSDVHVLINDDWEDGLSASIRCGITHIEQTSRYEKAILMVADQPYISSKHIKALIDKWKEGEASIIVSRYNKNFGPPNLFERVHFKMLTQLDGDKGAKNYIQENKDIVGFVDFPMGDIDLDTPQDLDRL